MFKPLFRFPWQKPLFAALSCVAAAVLPSACYSQVLIPQYTISTFAGSGSDTFAGDGGAATAAGLSVNSFAFDSSGNMFVADPVNNRVRKITSSGTISTVAGNGTKGYHGDGGNPVNAELRQPSSVAVDKSGVIYIADTGNQVIRKIGSDGKIVTFAGNNTSGAGYSGDGKGAFFSQLNTPTGLLVNANGDLYICDAGNNVVRKVVAGVINTIAGNGIPGFSDNVAATGGQLNDPENLALDSAGNLFIADTANEVIRRVDAQTGIMTTVAGVPYTLGFSGDGGPALQAQFNHPKSVSVDAVGNLFIADTYSSRIRMVTLNGTVATVAGNGTVGFSGDSGPAISASLGFPSQVFVDSTGKVYIDDSQNFRVRLLTPVPQTPAVGAGGVISASGYGAFATAAPGSFIEIYGTGLGEDTRTWTAADFVNNTAPSALDGTSVTVGGQPAFVYLVSPLQLDVLVPGNVAAGAQPVVVKTAMGTSNSVTVNVAPTSPGLLAPSSFLIGGKQYAVATFLDGVTYVAPTGAIPGIVSRPAKPGDIVILYGIGFGATTPSVPTGQIASGLNLLNTAPQFIFGSTPSTPTYAGLAPSFTGLYQFNLVVPAVTPNNAEPLSITLGGVAGTQTLYTAIGQ